MKILTFLYDGKPEQRVAYFHEYKENGTNLAHDFIREAPRYFCTSKMTNVVQLQGFAVQLAGVPSGFVAEDFIDGFEEDGKYAYHDEDNGLVVACDVPAPIKPPAKKFQHNMQFGQKNGYYVESTAGRGRVTIRESKSHNGEIVLIDRDWKVTYSPTAQDVIDALQKLG